MEETGMIHHYMIYSGFGRLLFQNDKRSSDKTLLNAVSKGFSNIITIFLCFWSDGPAKTEFCTQEIGALRFRDIFSLGVLSNKFYPLFSNSVHFVCEHFYQNLCSNQLKQK